jgi:hypothetical protein
MRPSSTSDSPASTASRSSRDSAVGPPSPSSCFQPATKKPRRSPRSTRAPTTTSRSRSAWENSLHASGRLFDAHTRPKRPCRSCKPPISASTSPQNVSTTQKALRSSSRRRSGTSSRSSSTIPIGWSRNAHCSKRCGALRPAITPTTCESSWPRSDASSSPTHLDRGTS